MEKTFWIIIIIIIATITKNKYDHLLASETSEGKMV